MNPFRVQTSKAVSFAIAVGYCLFCSFNLLSSGSPMANVATAYCSMPGECWSSVFGNKRAVKKNCLKVEPRMKLDNQEIGQMWSNVLLHGT